MRARLAFRLLLSLVPLFLSGSPLVAAEPIPLRAGPLSMVFEPDNALLRYITAGEHKVLQGINAPVRDQYWGTVSPAVENLRLQQNDHSFTLSFDVSCRQGDIDFFWQGEITGSPEGKVVFTFDGQARSTFLRNRIGFCVLHGPEAAGRPCVIETVDGETVNGHFPDFISPHQPFKNIRAIAHEVGDGVWAKLRMEGDTFEMEDQRNWTDASFKTYCTPLELPYPVRVPAGTKISHRIELSIEGVENVPDPVGEAGRAVVLRVSADREARKRMPGIGLQVSSQVEQLSRAEIARLRALRLSHLRVDLATSEKSSAAALRRAARQAEQLGVELYVGLLLGDDPEQELGTLSAALEEIHPPSTWLLIAADEPKVGVARQFLQRDGQNGRLGRGEDTNFTELNRNRPDTSRIDAVSYGLNPQIHAFDDTSMIETLAIQGDTVRSARQFAGDLPLLISPVTLRKQALNEPPPPGELPANVDPRQPTLFAAGWTLGSIKYLAEAGVEGATYYETVGWLGVMESESGTPLPERFPSRPRQLFPIYHVLRSLGEFAGGHVRETASSDPMSVIGLAVEKGDRRRLLLANLLPVPQTASVRGFAAGAELRRLDASHLTDEDPWRTIHGKSSARGDEGLIVELAPHGIAILAPQ